MKARPVEPALVADERARSRRTRRVQADSQRSLRLAPSVSVTSSSSSSSTPLASSRRSSTLSVAACCRQGRAPSSGSRSPSRRLASSPALISLSVRHSSTLNPREEGEGFQTVVPGNTLVAVLPAAKPGVVPSRCHGTMERDFTLPRAPTGWRATMSDCRWWSWPASPSWPSPASCRISSPSSTQILNMLSSALWNSQ